MIDGNTDLDDINDELGLELVSENSETLGGFIIELLGDLPDEEEKEDKFYDNLDMLEELQEND